mmetsp:Transcript_13152/g.31139  ORF Transcript_13152/g.31139 Transcript_13152/m.31139 type:complete len:222 (-) Transcript_13152:3681-4346(-)
MERIRQAKTIARRMHRRRDQNQGHKTQNRLVQRSNGSSTTTSRHHRRSGRSNAQRNQRRKMRIRQSHQRPQTTSNRIHIKNLQRKRKRLPLLRRRSSNRTVGDEKIPSMARRKGVHMDLRLQWTHQVLRRDIRHHPHNPTMETRTPLAKLHHRAQTSQDASRVRPHVEIPRNSRIMARTARQHTHNKPHRRSILPIQQADTIVAHTTSHSNHRRNTAPQLH